MKHKHAKYSCIYPLIFTCFVLLICCSNALAQPNSIRNFRTVEVSPDELRIIVDYTYNVQSSTQDVFIHAVPLEPGGSFHPQYVAFEELPVRNGTNSVVLTISKRSTTKNFTSKMIRVCMSSSGGAILCEDFPYTKKWGVASDTRPSADSMAQPTTASCVIQLLAPLKNAELSQRPIAGGKVEHTWRFSWSACPGATSYHLFVIGPQALNPIVNQNSIQSTSYFYQSTSYGITKLNGWTWKVRSYINGRWGEWSETRTFNVSPLSPSTEPCIISGRIDGKLEWDVKLEPDARPTRFTLTHVYYRSSDNKENGRIRINSHREYTFRGTAGKTYRIFPESFRSNPRERTVTCQPNTNHKGMNFRITGPPLYD